MNRLLRAKRFWDRSSVLTIKNSTYAQAVVKLFDEKVEEDSKKGDVTSNTLIKNNEITSGVIVAKQSGVIAGVEEVVFFLKKKKISCTPLKKDGKLVKKGSVILKMRAPVKKLVLYERTILNFLQRMSGIATIVHAYRKKTKAKVIGTRKTLFDLIDKKAISVGGGWTHRLNLSDAILIKENHLKALKGDIKTAIWRAAKHSTAKKIQIEVESKVQAVQAATLIANLHSKKQYAIMLDNFTPQQINSTIFTLKQNGLYNHVLLEASGNINGSNIARYGKIGVDAVSIGHITHSVKAFDLSLLLQ